MSPTAAPPQRQQVKLTAELAQEIIDTYRPIPHLFVQDVLKCNAWHKQSEIVQDVFKYKEVAVKTCNSIGKSFIAARIIIAFLTLYPGSKVVTTAPTWRQVKDILWTEIGAAMQMSAIKLTNKEVNQTRLDYAKDWFAIGLSAKEPEKFFGYHADFILVVVDEAGAVAEPIFRGVRAITTNENAHILYIGNPTNPDGTFYKTFQNPRVKRHTIGAFDTPNFTHNNIRTVQDLINIFTPPEDTDPLDWNPVLELPFPTLISPRYVYERYIEWGTDSPMWEALIMGEFPTSANNALIPLDLIQAAMNMRKEDKPDITDEMSDDERLAALNWDSGWNIPEGPLEFGVDVARFGLDSTVIAPRRGGFIDPLIVHSKKSTDVTTDLILTAFDPTAHGMNIRVDDTGVGGGVTDQLRRRKSDNNDSGLNPLWNYRVIPINFGSKAMDEKKYFDRRAEMYWHLRELMIQHKVALPLDLKLANELASIRYSFTQKDNKIRIETKDEIKKRLGASPDRADAVVLAFAPSGVGTFDAIQPQREAKPDLASVTNAQPAFKEPGSEQDMAEPIMSNVMNETF